jgi:hypothetical protein
MSGTVSTRWYFPDWLSDLGVRASSLAARGLWIDLLAIASSNKGRYHGFVVIAGRAPTTEQIARLINSLPDEVEKLLIELEKNGVFSRDKRGKIYSRRMVRAEKNRTNGRLGGNPKLLKTNESQNPVQPDPNPLIPLPIPKPSPEEESTPLPPKRGKRVAKTKATKPKTRREDQGHVIPPDWQPAGRCMALGRQKGFTTAQINDMAEAMREWSRANAHRKEARKTSWDDTFCNWIRRAEERSKEKSNGQNRSTGQSGDGSRNGFLNIAIDRANKIQEARSRETAEPIRPGGGPEPPTFDLLPEQPGESGATPPVDGGEGPAPDAGSGD